MKKRGFKCRIGLNNGRTSQYEFHVGPMLYHRKEVMFYTAERKRARFVCVIAQLPRKLSSRD
jgi:hypothetical protein